MASGYNISAILSVTNRFTQPLNQFRQQMSNIQQTTRQATSTINNSMNSTVHSIGSTRSQVMQLGNQYRAMGHSASSSMRQAWQQVRNTQQATQQASRSMRDFTSNSRGLDGMVSKFKNLAISIGGIIGVKKIFDSASEMENYRNTLNVVMKDTELAGQKIKEAKEFANKTPFETKDIVEGMVKLESYGVGSSEAIMTNVGNMAGVMNKSFDQAVEAIADAQTGELERLTFSLAS